MLNLDNWTLASIVSISFVGWFLCIWKGLSTRRDWRMDPAWVESLMPDLNRGRIARALAICRQRRDFSGRLVGLAIEASHAAGQTSQRRHRRLVAREGKRLQGGLHLVSTCTVSLPLLGLLGTVFGMIKTFEILDHAGGNPAAELMATGISDALITTQAGLAAALPIMLMHGMLASRIRRCIRQTNRCLKRIESAIGQSH